MTQSKSGFAIWITGLPASGKSTLTNALIERLVEEGIGAQVLESDVMREKLAPNLGYSKEERESFYRLLINVGELLVQNGVNVILDATAAKREFREEARRRFAKFMEVYVSSPLEVCEERDPKNIYEKAKKGEYQDVPGVQAEYEPPENPEFEVDTSKQDVKEEAGKIAARLKEKGFV